MKRIITSVSISIVTVFLIYLLGSFVAASFNIATWSPGSRAVTSFLMACGFGIAFGAAMSNINN